MLAFRLLPFLLVHALYSMTIARGGGDDAFVRTNGIQFVVNGKPFYANGFNAYWLMTVASTQEKIVSTTISSAAAHNLKLIRTWAFSDGGYLPLQSSPGIYDEEVFKGLDFVVSEARKKGVKLILSLVNNYKDYGGKGQYVQWGREAGEELSSDDDFFTNPVVKGFYKNHVKAVVSRVNRFTGVAYRDDPTIMAWELMNEPRINSSSSSANSIHWWIGEMAAYVKSIDKNHLVEAGLEGFYGNDKLYANPGNLLVGTDFIANNQLSNIDFCTVHSYPDIWLPQSSFNDQLGFLKKWVEYHIEDAEKSIKKPVVFAEFGRRLDSSTMVSERDELYWVVFSAINASAINNGAASGGLFWQVVGEGLASFNDGYGILLAHPSSTMDIIDSFSMNL